MPRPTAGVAAWRKLVQAAVDASSYRAVAGEIGLSQSGLHSFLAGTRPHPATLTKVSAWAARHGTGRAQSVDPREVDAAVALLLRHIETAPNAEVAEKRRRQIVTRLENG